jgi:serine/threonine protein kinase
MSADAAPIRSDTPNALPPGTRLGEFELLKVIGAGGFGIVYLAIDHTLEREVAIKEYMPASLAGRTETMHVSLRSHNDAESFAMGLKSFINEAKLLARFDHPSLLKVHRFWEANGTAYMAMPVLRGRTIKEVRAELGGPPEEPWLLGVMQPLLGAIERLHSEGVYHRDIAPDNIQIEPDGRPVLLDFGAARRVLSDRTQTLTAILKPAYAPIEQYGEAGSVKQGPWTDLYALGATLYYVLMGRAPAPATARAFEDDHEVLSTEQLPGCSERFLHVIDWMLRPRPADRPQSVAQLRAVLEGQAPVPRRTRTADVPEKPWERTDVLAPPAPPRAQADTLDLDLGSEETMVMRRAPPAPPPQAEARTGLPSMPPLDMAAERPPVAAAAGKRSSALPLVLGVLGVLATAGVAAYLFWPRPAAEVPLAPVAASAASAAAPVAASAPLAASAAAASEAAVAAVGPASVPASAPALAPAVAEAASAPAPSAPAPTAAPEPPVAPVPAARPPTTAATAAEKPAPRREPRPAEASRPVARPEPVPATPGPSCGPREAVRYHVCMERECGGAEFGSHPACQRWRTEAGR